MKKILPLAVMITLFFASSACKKSCGLAPNATQLYKKGNKCFFYSENEQGEKIKVDYPCENCIH